MNYTANDNLEIMKFAKNYNNFLVNSIMDLIICKNYKSILDFGCADGYFINMIQSEVKNLNIMGVEVDKTSYNVCKKNNIKVHKNIDEINNKFDLIYSFNVLEHINDDVSILQKIYNKLNNEGVFVIYVPALMFLYSSMDEKTGHYRRYSKKELTTKLRQVGFNIKKIEYCDSLGVLATLLYIAKDKLLKNNNGNISKNSILVYDNIFLLSRLLDKIVFKQFCGKNLLAIAVKNS